MSALGFVLGHPGLVVFTVVSAALAAYLVYSMLHPERF
jgi:K+-transporting ATPase KdpF subunit